MVSDAAIETLERIMRASSISSGVRSSLVLGTAARAIVGASCDTGGGTGGGSEGKDVLTTVGGSRLGSTGGAGDGEGGKYGGACDANGITGGGSALISS
jgi:hypothetical protein